MVHKSRSQSRHKCKKKAVLIKFREDFESKASMKSYIDIVSIELAQYAWDSTAFHSPVVCVVFLALVMNLLPRCLTCFWASPVTHTHTAAASSFSSRGPPPRPAVRVPGLHKCISISGRFPQQCFVQTVKWKQWNLALLDNLWCYAYCI